MRTGPLLEELRAHDAESARHSERVAAYALVLGAAVGGIPLHRLRSAALLHDLGKSGVPAGVLTKPNRLDPAEREAVERHPEIGEALLRAHTADALVLGAVRSHHERWDGAGYPDGLRGEEIPLAARVLAVADTLDAMGAARPYRPGLAWEAIEAEILRCRGTQFDPAVVVAFLSRREVLRALMRSGGAEDAEAA